MTKALIEHLHLHHPHTFTIHTLASQAPHSRPAETAFTDTLAPADGSEYSLGGSSTGSCGGRRRVVRISIVSTLGKDTLFLGLPLAVVDVVYTVYI